MLEVEVFLEDLESQICGTLVGRTEGRKPAIRAARIRLLADKTKAHGAGRQIGGLESFFVGPDKTRQREANWGEE